MENKKTTKNKNVEVNSRELMDPKTGEIITVKQIVQQSKDNDFEKVWLTHLLDAIDEVTTKKFEVMRYMMENKNNQNLVIATQKKISNETGVSRRTVSEAIQILKEKDFLTMLQNGVYKLNPNHIFRGGHNQRMDVLRTYYKEKAKPEGQTTIEEHQKEE